MRAKGNLLQWKVSLSNFWCWKGLKYLKWANYALSIQAKGDLGGLISYVLKMKSFVCKTQSCDWPLRALRLCWVCEGLFGPCSSSPCVSPQGSNGLWTVCCLQGRFLCGGADELPPELEERGGGAEQEHAAVHRDGKDPAGRPKPRLWGGEGAGVEPPRPP